MRVPVTAEQMALAELEAENNRNHFLARAAQMGEVAAELRRRRHQRELQEVNSREDGARRARRSEPSGPSALGVIHTLAVLSVLGVVAMCFVGAGVTVALSRWGWDRIFGGRTKS
ncbi:MAG TPA: hypothetical protein VNG04_05395 [Candidatus Acidoferrum sp.]|nr:hypothetical protein [Candidatus Acidoferrum sp.]